MLKLRPGRFLGSRESSRETTRIRVSEVSYDRGSALPKHCHESAHFCLVTAGYYTERLAGNDHQRAPLDCVWYPPEVDHSERHETSGRHILLEIDPRHLRTLEDESAPSDAPLTIRNPTAWRTAALLLDEFAAPVGSQDSLAIESLAFELLAEASAAPRPPDRSPPPWLLDVDELLESCFAQAISLGAVAREIGVHRCHLAKTFRLWRSTSIGEQVRRLRIENTCRLLASSDSTLADIAYATGFADQAHLSNTFNRMIGVTPGRYRASWRQALQPID